MIDAIDPNERCQPGEIHEIADEAREMHSPIEHMDGSSAPRILLAEPDPAARWKMAIGMAHLGSVEVMEHGWQLLEALGAAPAPLVVAGTLASPSALDVAATAFHLGLPTRFLLVTSRYDHRFRVAHGRLPNVHVVTTLQGILILTTITRVARALLRRAPASDSFFVLEH